MCVYVHVVLCVCVCVCVRGVLAVTSLYPSVRPSVCVKVQQMVISLTIATHVSLPYVIFCQLMIANVFNLDISVDVRPNRQRASIAFRPISLYHLDLCHFDCVCRQVFNPDLLAMTTKMLEQLRSRADPLQFINDRNMIPFCLR